MPAQRPAQRLDEFAGSRFERDRLAGDERVAVEKTIRGDGLNVFDNLTNRCVAVDTAVLSDSVAGQDERGAEQNQQKGGEGERERGRGQLKKSLPFTLSPFHPFS